MQSAALKYGKLIIFIKYNFLVIFLVKFYFE